MKCTTIIIGTVPPTLNMSKDNRLLPIVLCWRNSEPWVTLTTGNVPISTTYCTLSMIVVKVLNPQCKSHQLVTTNITHCSVLSLTISSGAKIIVWK